MDEKFEIQVLDKTDLPSVSLPTALVWDLVEYLSWQRVAVIYTYEGGRFIVRFTHSTPTEAQRVVDEWATSHALVPSGGRERSDAWVVGSHSVDPG